MAISPNQNESPIIELIGLVHRTREGNRSMQKQQMPEILEELQGIIQQTASILTAGGSQADLVVGLGSILLEVLHLLLVAELVAGSKFDQAAVCESAAATLGQRYPKSAANALDRHRSYVPEGLDLLHTRRRGRIRINGETPKPRQDFRLFATTEDLDAIEFPSGQGTHRVRGPDVGSSSVPTGPIQNCQMDPLPPLSPRTPRVSHLGESSLFRQTFLGAAAQLSESELRDFVKEHVGNEVARIKTLPQSIRAQEFRALCAEWHPDKCPGIRDIATDVFQNLQAQKQHILPRSRRTRLIA